MVVRARGRAGMWLDVDARMETDRFVALYTRCKMQSDSCTTVVRRRVLLLYAEALDALMRGLTTTTDNLIAGQDSMLARQSVRVSLEPNARNGTTSVHIGCDGVPGFYAVLESE